MLAQAVRVSIGAPHANQFYPMRTTLGAIEAFLVGWSASSSNRAPLPGIGVHFEQLTVQSLRGGTAGHRFSDSLADTNVLVDP